MAVEFEKGRKENREGGIKVFYQILSVDEQEGLKALEVVVMGSGFGL